jgi:cobyrinic acid a,c-diamide synthase
MDVPRVVIAGTHSGCGKTSVAAGVLRVLARRGMSVQPYKVGPDFLDPPHLSMAAGRLCRNLDGWMLPQATLVEVFARGAAGAGVAVIEGMMGLFDGIGGTGDEGSTAEVARWLGAPVVLVVDVSASARSAAAAALGFTGFDPRINVAGVIANRTGGPRHVQTLRDALGSSGVPLLGVLPTNPDVAIAERHLGLLPPDDAVVDALADAVEEYVDLDAVLRIARTAPPVVVAGSSAFPPMPMASFVRIGIARDEAFSFYYQDALEMLEAHGAQLVPFSPLHDTDLPSVEGIYIGGGYPEAHAEGLGANAAMRHVVAAAVADGLPTYAECGGLLYLTERIEDAGGQAHPMAGVIPGVSRMHRRPAALSYVNLEAIEDSLLLRAGESVRGHEFHHSTVELRTPGMFAYRSIDGRGLAEGFDGYRLPGGVASYAHLHLAANPAMAQRFIEACRVFSPGRNR